MTRVTRWACVLLTMAAVAVPATAWADSGHISVNVGNGWTRDSTEPLFDSDPIAPGWSGSRDLQVRNDSDTDAALLLSATDIVGDENGCNHPETYADTTCA